MRTHPFTGLDAVTGQAPEDRELWISVAYEFADSWAASRPERRPRHHPVSYLKTVPSKKKKKTRSQRRESHDDVQQGRCCRTLQTLALTSRVICKLPHDTVLPSKRIFLYMLCAL